MRCLAFFLLVAAGLIGCANQTETDQSKNNPETSSKSPVAKTRTFEFVYGAVLTNLEPGAQVRVWLPVAQSGHDQKVERIETNLPGDYELTTESKFGNELIYFEATANKAGEVPIEVKYKVTRNELTKENYEAFEGETATFLAATEMVPTDDSLRIQFMGDSELIGDELKIARKLYDGVLSHMAYDKPADKPGWGNGDAEWACGNGFGNCTDFHSLFISSVRNMEIPSRFEIGFPIPPLSEKEPVTDGKVGGYHCWAKFLTERHWVPVDISEADKHPEMTEYYFGSLTADRVQFSIGRDLTLVPAPAAKTVNYLAYPYAEVGGKQHKGFRKEFRFSDIEPDTNSGSE